MKLRCIYCAHLFEAPELPPACPSCAATFSQVVTPDTPVKDIVRALAKNGCSPVFDLIAEVFDMADEKVQAEGFAPACAPDQEPRPAGCACHVEAGDSTCPVHGDDEP